MAPPGPPPYTLEQINAMTSPEERLRARAELKSYIARMKKEKEERLAYETYRSNGYSGRIHSGGSPLPGSKRGGYTYGGSGYGSYHPYQRPQPPYVAQKFKNRSVTFGKPDSGTESPEANEAAAPSLKGVNDALQRPSSQQQIAPTTLCPALTSTGILEETTTMIPTLPSLTSNMWIGVCSRHGCRYLHDPTKQALCKRWLYKNDCPKGDFCPLSHKTSPHNAPTCLHFQDGRCKNEDCRFAHVRINPAAPNCDTFGRLGYCEKGNECTELHAHECPSFSNTGVCSFGEKCRLGHVHRASRMRKAARSSSVDGSSPSDTAEEDVEVAKDSQKGIMQSTTASVHNPHQFTQQADFVPLDADD